MKQLSKHLNFANVISCIALFVALSGAAYAATTLGRKSVKAQNLANGAVSTLKLRGGAVTTLKLRNDAVTGPKIAAEAVGTSELAGGAVRAGQLGGGVVTEAKLKDGAVTNGKIGAGAITDFHLAPDAVGAGKILRGSITTKELSEVLLKQLVKNLTYVTNKSESSTSTSKSVGVECPFGRQVTGGGARIAGTTTGVAITSSAPVIGFENKASAWSAAAQAVGAETEPWALEVFAICAEL